MKALSGKELARVLERHGWTLTRMSSSHFRYDKPGHNHIVIPVHGNRTLKQGMQCAIMKQAGLSASDL